MEEITHLIRRGGIMKAYPEVQERLEKATQAAIDRGFYRPHDGLPADSFSDEYLAWGLDIFYGAHRRHSYNGVALTPEGYLFVMVFLGFLVILAGTLRIVGGFTAGAVFVLEGLGVEVEKALAMTLIVQAATLSTVALCGAAALWAQGLTLTGAFTPGDGRATAGTGSDENGGRDA